MKIDRVHFYTRNAARTRDWFIHNVGFKAIGSYVDRHTRTEAIALNSVFFLLSSPLNSASPVARYLKSHPSGVVDIAFRVKNIAEIIDRASTIGVKLLQNIRQERSHWGSFKYAKIAGWNSLEHTLIEASDRVEYCLPNFELEQRSVNHHKLETIDIDHVVLNVNRGELDSAVKLYQTLFNFRIQQSFEIQTDKSGLTSQALIDEAGGVQFNINQPTSPNSQIQEFIDLNCGSGIQHIALRSQNLIADMTQLQQHDLKFLGVPQAYYRSLESLSLSVADKTAIAKLQILVDRDRHLPKSLLMQIFTQPIFEQPTFFLEFIERRSDARGFGQGNFKALFEAVEREQEKRVLSRSNTNSRK